MRFLLLLVLVLLVTICQSANGQLSLTSTEMPIVTGLVKPVVVGQYIVVGANSSPKLAYGMYIDVICDHRKYTDLEIEAEQPGTLEEGELVRVDHDTWLLVGSGKYRVTATIFDPPRERARIFVELGPPPPPMTVTVTNPQVDCLLNAPITPVKPVVAAGGKGKYIYSADVLPVGLSIASDGVVTGVPGNIGQVSSTITVTDEAGQTATGSVKFSVTDKPKPPPVPPDAFNNIGQRVAQWSIGFSKRKEVASTYRTCVNRLRSEPNYTINSAVEAMVVERGKVLTSEELRQYQPMIDQLNADMKGRWPMQRLVLADYLECIAKGLEAGQ